MSSAFDVLVVGGGPAGSAAAIVLARAGLAVAIAERERFPREKVCGEFVSGPTWTLLENLGVAAELLPHAGPPVELVGFFSDDVVAQASMPRARRGRAIGRDRLDATLLAAAAAAGASVFQPAIVERCEASAELQLCHLRTPGGEARLEARLVIDAHGSWLAGPYGTKPPPTPGDLLGFKARFHGARLAVGVMPLVLFPGGYGGLVHTEGGLVSFSCCIRRDVLEALPRAQGAGTAVFEHVSKHCRGFREAMAGAIVAGRWHGAGPIRPGIRPRWRPGRLAAGNAAGEAHPLVAEGISMALQSGWLCAQTLRAGGGDAAGVRYARQWRNHFGPRIAAASAFATLAHRGRGAMTTAIRLVPALLTAGALFSGKARPVPFLEAR